MSQSSNIITGFFGAFALSCSVLVLAPQAQIGGLQPLAVEDEPGSNKFSDIYPVQNYAVEQGRAIYVREGCITCHSQQIRDPQNGSDIERGWGARRTVARDYIYERPPFLGSSRLGPDLSNAGWSEWRDEVPGDTRKPKRRDAAWHFAHLYQPQIVVRESNHPPYRYLFDERKIVGERSSEALTLVDPSMPGVGIEVVPTPAARSLVAYLLSLNRSHALPEAGPAPAAPATGATPGAAPASTPAK